MFKFVNSLNNCYSTTHALCRRRAPQKHIIVDLVLSNNHKLIRFLRNIFQTINFTSHTLVHDHSIPDITRLVVLNQLHCSSIDTLNL